MSAFSSVDLPALGRPMMETKPDRIFMTAGDRLANHASGRIPRWCFRVSPTLKLPVCRSYSKEDSDHHLSHTSTPSRKIAASTTVVNEIAANRQNPKPTNENVLGCCFFPSCVTVIVAPPLRWSVSYPLVF
jgi:hypothetical protein